ncbi:MAG: nicotinate-nucleotide adenylyltransferase [Hyphomicrobiales bacterium]
MALRLPAFSPGQRIGLYGGSFNPAHEGHVAVAHQAIKRLQLDHVWWLVSPQNPLKDSQDTADFQERLQGVKNLVVNPAMVPTDLEQRLGTWCTAETFRRLRPVFNRGNFVWIMGADSFAELHRWKDWRVIPETLPLAIFDRPGWRLKALASKAARRYSAGRLTASDAALLPLMAPPAWVFLPMPLRHESSTAIRNRENGDR